MPVLAYELGASKVESTEVSGGSTPHKNRGCATEGAAPVLMVRPFDACTDSNRGQRFVPERRSSALLTFAEAGTQPSSSGDQGTSSTRHRHLRPRALIEFLAIC